MTVLKRYELSLLVRQTNESSSFSMKSIDKIEGDTLLELTSKLPFLIVRIMDAEREEQILKEINDDIPF